MGNMNKEGLPVKQVARFMALLLVAACTIWGLYLMVVGLPTVATQATVPGGPPPPTFIVYQPYYTAIYSLLGLGLMTLGLLNDKSLGWAWAGIALHLIAGGLLIFSQGMVYILFGGIAAVPVGILHTQVGNRKFGLIGAWSGIGILLMMSFVLSGPFGIFALIAGIGLALIVAGFNWHNSRRTSV